MIITSIATLKGGEGKTFTAALLSRYLSMKGRVLAVSICSQNDINIYMGGKVGINQLYQAIQNNDIKQSIISTEFKEIDLVPYDINDTPSVDRLMQSLTGSENRLKILLNQVKEDYDYIVLDTGPNLNISTISAIVASDYLISPTLMRISSINGYIATNNAVKEMKDLEMSHCKHIGIIKSQSNINRDTETFEVEDYIEKEKLNILGLLPSSSALKKALYSYKSFDNVKPHHMEKVNELFNNILKQIA